MRQLLNRLSQISLFISGSCIVLMTIIISYQVVARYVFNASPAWSERLSLLLLGYLVFFGAATGVHERFHIRIDALRNAVPAPVGRAFDKIANIAVAVAGIVLIIAGARLTTTLWAFDIPSLGLPRGLALLPIPFAAAQLFETSDPEIQEGIN